MPAGNRILRTFFALTAMAGMAGLARADFEDDYQTGLKALDSGHLVEAREFLRKALAAQPSPVDKVKVNDNDWQPYLPYHFLGVVAYKLGDCADAQAQWGNATNKRMLGRLLPLRKQETSLLAACEQKASDLAKEEKSTNPQSKESAPAEAPSVVATPTPAADNTATVAANEKIERPGNAPGSDAKNASDRPQPPPALVQAFDNYLAGRYREAARIDPETFARARIKLHAYLLRAAARFTLSEIDGSKNQLDDARADARAAYAIDAHLVPDVAMFSPRFRAFYAQAH